MGLSNSGPVSPLPSNLGPIPQPSLPATPPSSSPSMPAIPVIVRDPTSGTNPESLAKRDVVIFPQHLLSCAAEALLAPARILAYLTQGGATPKEKAPAQENIKSNVVQRDETSSKGDSGKGEDIVNIQVFDSEHTGDLQNKEEKPQTDNQKSPSQGAPKENSAVKGQPESQPSLKGEGAKQPQDPVSKPNSESSQTKGEVPQKEIPQPNSPKENAPDIAKESPLPVPTEKKEPPAENTSIKQELPAPPSSKSNEGGGEKATPFKSTPESTPNLSGPKENISVPKEIKETGKPLEQVVVGKAPSSHEESIAQPSQEILRHGGLEKPKDNPDRIVDKIRDKENLEAVEREDKYSNVQHPQAHRVLESERVDYRGDAALPGEIHVPSSLESDVLIMPWLAIFAQEQQENEKLRRSGKGRGGKRAFQAVEYRLADILFMLLCAAVGGCKNIADYILFIRAREKWFKIVLGPQCQMPPKELFWRVLFSLNSQSFHEIMEPWLEELTGNPAHLVNSNGKPILPAISMWETSLGLLFSQSKGSANVQGRYAIPILLKAFNVNQAIIMADALGAKYNAAIAIEKFEAKYVVEADEKASEVIDMLIEKADKEDSQVYSVVESYIEGYERIIIESLVINANNDILKESSTSTAYEVLKIYSENMTSSGSSSQIIYMISGQRIQKEDIFDLIRAQQPLKNKTAWHLNCLMPAYPIEFAMQQSLANIRLLQEFAIHLLAAKNEEGSIEEKMQLASRNNEALLKFVSS